MRILMTAGGMAGALNDRTEFSVRVGEDWYGFQPHSGGSDQWTIRVEMASAFATTAELRSRIEKIPREDENLTDFRKFAVNRVAGAE